MPQSNVVADPITPHQGNGTSPVELSTEARDALVARARDIIAGRMPPPELGSTPEIDAHMQREYGHLEPPPTTEALRFLKNQLLLDAHHSGQVVACLLLDNDELAVLAVGQHEVQALLQSLSDEQGSKVVVVYPGV